MKTNRYSSLWLTFVWVVLAVLVLSAGVLGGCVLLLYRLGAFSVRPLAHFPGLFLVLLLSVLISTALSLVVGKRILRPIIAFSKATKQIAAGDFTVRFKEDYRTRELAEMGQNFNHMVKELNSIETLRSDFVVNVSHEFKTPISTIEGYAMLLQDEDMSKEERSEYTGMILASARQLSNLSGNILRLSKLERQETIEEARPFRLDEQIRQAILLLEPQWSAKQLSLSPDLDKVTYTGDEALMMQVWTNLIANAVKFTPEHGAISVHLKVSGEEATITVEDSGIGMEPEVMAHIFEKFYQGDSARACEGNGLGLALTKRIVELCHGTIQVESTPGQGSRFTVRLPLTLPL